MTDPHTPPAPDPATNRSALIESIYRIALEPQTYDSFMGQWDEFILQQIAKLEQLQTDTAHPDKTLDDPEITTHFTLAMQLLEQAGRPEETADHASTSRTRVPQLVFSGNGALVWHNHTARTVFTLQHGLTLDDFNMSDSHRAALDALFLNAQATTVVLVQITPQGSDKALPMAFQMSKASPTEQLFTATQVRQSWPERTDRLLAKGFGLSQSEIDICALLVEGQNTTDIASTRNSALATVRTQIKKILHKTDSASQVELVSLLHATMRIAEDTSARNPPAAKIPDRQLNIQLNTRVMPVDTFGDPNGTPVLFFHGMLDGNAMTAALRHKLTAQGFHLICPVRPCFGTAQPDLTGTIAQAPALLAKDIETLMDQMGIKQALLLGHMAGALYAYAAAARLGPRVAGILSISGAVPITSPAQFASMSVRQRIVALTARYTPRVLPFVIRAGINQLDNAGERQFLASLYQNSPHDQRATSDPETRDIIISGYHFTIAQGHSAFEIDSYHVVRDWSQVNKGQTHPVELLHGAGDPVVSIASVRHYKKVLGARARLTELPNHGQLVFYEAPEAVVAALERLRDGTA